MARLPMRALSFAGALLVASCATGNQASPAVDGPGQSVSPGSSEGASSTGGETVAGTRGDLDTDVCEVSVVVPEGWDLDGATVHPSGEGLLANLFVLSRERGQYDTLDSLADGTLTQIVNTPNGGWESSDGGRFGTLDGRDAWLVSGSTVDSQFGALWVVLTVILTDVCEVNLLGRSEPGDVVAQESIRAMLDSVQIRP